MACKVDRVHAVGSGAVGAYALRFQGGKILALAATKFRLEPRKNYSHRAPMARSIYR